MIGSLRGPISARNDKFIIIETGGVGYRVSVSPDILSKTHIGKEIFLLIHTHVREDALDLYGFESENDLVLFEMLLGVSGIGPKSALGILSIASIDTLRQAIGTGDTSYLTKVSGIGRKTAEKIVIELRDKIGMGTGDAALQEELDALEALKSLGYSQAEAREALKKVAPGTDTNSKIREALKILGGK